jgi:hypothetical protein
MEEGQIALFLADFDHQVSQIENIYDTLDTRSTVLTSKTPNIAKAGGLQSQGVKGEAVISYRNPLTTQDLKSSGFPARVNNMVKSIPSFEFTDGDIRKIVFLL